jgi:dihydroflavonol-4-reductase
LEDGLSVQAAVRDPNNQEKVRHLKQLAENAPGSIKFFKADLLADGSYADAMAECELVFHTASPFITTANDPQTELIEPALNGTQNVLEQANQTASVKRVVLTSSCAAIYGDNIDLKKTAKGYFTEEDWNETSSIEHAPYSYSKTLAERKAWEIAGAQERWDLVVVNPSLVIGPGINARSTSESYRLIKQFGDGKMKIGAPDYGIGIVDVRDLADAHMAAAFNPDAKGRHIISGHNTSFPKMGNILRGHFGDKYPFPRKTLQKITVWIFGPILDKTLTRKTVSRNVGYPFRADNSKSVGELGIKYRPLEESLVDFFQQMIDNGEFEKK